MSASRTGADQAQGPNGKELHDILRQAVAQRWSKEKLREALFNTDEQQPPRTPRPLIDFGDTPPDPSKTLLGRRFLCREGGMLFVGPSGIGKTSASVQQDLLWSIGQPAFGIVPRSPLRTLRFRLRMTMATFRRLFLALKKDCDSLGSNAITVVRVAFTWRKKRAVAMNFLKRLSSRS